MPARQVNRASGWPWGRIIRTPFKRMQSKKEIENGHGSSRSDLAGCGRYARDVAVAPPPAAGSSLILSCHRLV
jgi:hypothetical protein